MAKKSRMTARHLIAEVPFKLSGLEHFFLNLGGSPWSVESKLQTHDQDHQPDEAKRNADRMISGLNADLLGADVGLRA